MSARVSGKKLPQNLSPTLAQKRSLAPSRGLPERKKIALALQGGGSFGAFTWGVLDAFLEDGRLEIEGVSGTSAGALNALALTQGLARGGAEEARKSLRTLWEKVAEYSVFSPYQSTPGNQEGAGAYSLDHSVGYIFMNALQTVLSPYQFNPMNYNVLRNLLEEVFDFDLIREKSPAKIFLCATQVFSGKLKIFQKPDVSLDVAQASCCLPSLFHAVQVDGEYYWDGGFVGNPAIYPLIYHCTTPDVLVVQLSVMNRKRLPMTADEILSRHKEITYNACLMREMRSIEFVTRLIDQGTIQGDFKRLFMHLIRDEDFFSTTEVSSALNSQKGFVELLFHQGYQVAKAWLAENFDAIGVRSTTDLHKDFV